MATVFYDKASVELGVGNVTESLLASDCSLTYNNAQQALYSIGRKGSLGQFPSAARAADLSFNFLTTITGNPSGYYTQGNIINFLASGIKNSVGSEASGVTVKFAGVTGIGFLNSYSFSIASNSVSTSSASLSFYGDQSQLPITGFLHGQVGVGTTNNTNDPFLNTGVAHGRYTTLSPLASTRGSETANIYGADYSISFGHNPIYKLGQEFPATTLYTTAQESVNVTEDLFDSGLKFNETAQDLTLTISGLGVSVDNSISHSMDVGIKGAKQISTSMSAGLDDIVRTQKTLTSSY